MSKALFLTVFVILAVAASSQQAGDVQALMAAATQSATASSNTTTTVNSTNSSSSDIVTVQQLEYVAGEFNLIAGEFGQESLITGEDQEFNMVGEFGFVGENGQMTEEIFDIFVPINFE